MSLSVRNRNDSYRKLNLSKSEAIVYEGFKTIAPATDNQVMEFLHLRINQVTGRRNKLVEKGYLKAVDSIPGPFGKDNTVWDLTNDQFVIF